MSKDEVKEYNRRLFLEYLKSRDMKISSMIIKDNEPGFTYYINNRRVYHTGHYNLLSISELETFIPPDYWAYREYNEYYELKNQYGEII